MLVLVVLAVKLDSVTVTKEPKMEFFAHNTYEETITVVADRKYPPYSFQNEEGEMVGGEIELINAIANEMQVNLDIQFVSWEDALNAMKNGEADVILGLDYKQKYKDLFNLTTPVEINQYVAYGKEDYESLQQFHQKRIGAINYGSSEETILSPLALDNIITYDFYEDAFADIQNNKLDYLIGRYAVGNRVLAEQGITDVKAVGSVLGNNAFCFGMQKS